MKKKNKDQTLFNSDILSNKNLIKDQVKTTDINILLNRVKLDKEKTFKKRIIFSCILFVFVSLIIFVVI